MKTTLSILFFCLTMYLSYGQTFVKSREYLRDSVDPRLMRAGQFMVVLTNDLAVTYYSVSNTVDTDSAVEFNSVLRPGYSWKHPWNGDVRIFGAVPFQSRYGLTPWSYKTTNAPIGTNNFSVFVRTTFPTTYKQPYGMFELGPIPGTNMSTSPDQLSSFGLRATPDVWGITFRGTNGGSGAGSTVNEGAILESSPAALAAYAGQTVNLVVTRSGTNATIYFNGTDVTSLFTLNNPAGWAKSLALGQNVHVQVGNNANIWYWPNPTTRFALWTNVLNASQAANPDAVAGKLIDYTPDVVTQPADLTASLNAASDYLSSIGGAELYLPPGIYRVDGEIKIGKQNTWRGAGSSPYPSSFRQGYRPTTTTIVPWFGATNRVFYADQTMSGEVCLTARVLGSLGNVVTSSRWLRSSISDLMISGDLSYSSEGIVLDRIAAFEADSIGFRGLQNHEIRAVACNALKIVNCDGGNLGRGVEVRAVADFDMRDCFLDGARGANIKMIGNLSRIADCVGEYALNPRTSVPPLESPASANTSTDQITVTNSYGHKFHIGQAVRFDLDDAIVATITITNPPAVNATLSINGFVRTWSSATTKLTIETNSSVNVAATNLVNAYVTNNLPNIVAAQSATNALTMTLSKGFDLSIIPSSGWCTVSYVTNAALPTPLSVNTDYYVIPTGENTFKVSVYYADEVSLYGSMYSNSVVDITSTGTGLWYVGTGPAVGFYINGDHNSISGCQSQQNYEGSLIVEGVNGNNAFTANHFITSGLGNNVANVPAVTIINSFYNRFVNNSIDDRDTAFSQIGFFADAASDYGSFIGNSWNIDTPYLFADVAKQYVSDAKQNVFQWNGTYGNLYVPARTASWGPWNVEDWEFSSSIEYDKVSGRLYLSTGYTADSTNFNYAVTFPAEGPMFWRGDSGNLSIANNGAGQNVISIKTTPVQYPIYYQINSSTSQGFDIGTFRNFGTNSSTYVALPAFTKLGELIYGGWFGATAGEAAIGAGLSFWSDAGTWSSTNRSSQANILVTPQNTISRVAAVTFNAPASLTTNDTMLLIATFNGTSWTAASKRVSFGTNDSAGAGFKVLRVSN